MSDFSSDSASRRQAADASSDAAAAKRKATEAENDLARMKLACAAVWELVKEKIGLTEDDLIAKMAILDAKDGVADGKLTRGVRKCASCGRTLPAKQYKCMYCGTTQPIESVFESL
jgi:hypothetical protein